MPGLLTPTQLALAFAANGVFNTIPVPSQVSTNPGLASYNDGFPPATRAPIASGGIPPYGEDMNGILNAVTVALQYEQAGGGYAFSSGFAASIGGYPLGATVNQSDGNGMWMNLTAGNSANPETSGTTGWRPVNKKGQLSQALLSTAAVALTNLQSAYDTIILTGVPTLAITVTLAPFAKSWRIINQCTGSFATVSVNVTGGAAVSIQPGGEAQVYSDGTNMLLPGAEQVGAGTQSGHAAQMGQLTGVVGTAVNLKCVLGAAGTSLTYTADQVIGATALNGLPYLMPSLNQALNGATTGIGGLDTGALAANSFYSVYAALNPVTGAQGIFAQLEPAGGATTVYGGANRPAGYTVTSLIGVWPTNGSSQFSVGSQYGRTFNFAASGVYSGSGVVSLATINLASVVPKAAKFASGNVSITVSTSGISSFNIFDQTATGASTIVISVNTGNATSGGNSNNFGRFPILTPQTWYISSTQSATISNMNVALTQYEF